MNRHDPPRSAESTDCHPAWWVMLLVGAAGILAPGVMLGVAAHAGYGDVRYSAYVFGLIVGVHSVVWLVLAGLTWRRIGRRFVEAFSLGSWSALAAAAAAVTGIDHPYVYLAAYAVVSVAVTLGVWVLASRRLARSRRCAAGS